MADLFGSNVAQEVEQIIIESIKQEPSDYDHLTANEFEQGYDSPNSSQNLEAGMGDLQEAHGSVPEWYMTELKALQLPNEAEAPSEQDEDSDTSYELPSPRPKRRTSKRPSSSDFDDDTSSSDHDSHGKQEETAEEDEEKEEEEEEADDDEDYADDISNKGSQLIPDDWISRLIEEQLKEEIEKNGDLSLYSDVDPEEFLKEQEKRKEGQDGEINLIDCLSKLAQCGYSSTVVKPRETGLSSLQKALLDQVLKTKVDRARFTVRKNQKEQGVSSDSLSFLRFTYKSNCEIKSGTPEQAREYDAEVEKIEEGQAQVKASLELGAVAFNEEKLKEHLLHDIKEVIEGKETVTDIEKCSAKIGSLRHKGRLFIQIRNNLISSLKQKISIEEWIHASCLPGEKKDDEENALVICLKTHLDHYKTKLDGYYILIKSDNLADIVVCRIHGYNNAWTNILELDPEAHRIFCQFGTRLKTVPLLNGDLLSQVFNSRKYFECEVLFIPFFGPILSKGRSLCRVEPTNSMFNELLSLELALKPNLHAPFRIIYDDYHSLDYRGRRALLFALHGTSILGGPNVLVIDASRTQTKHNQETSLCDTIFYQVVKNLIAWQHEFPQLALQDHSACVTSDEFRRSFNERCSKPLLLSLKDSDFLNQYEEKRKKLTRKMRLLIVGDNSDIIRFLCDEFRKNKELFYYATPQVHHSQSATLHPAPNEEVRAKQEELVKMLGAIKDELPEMIQNEDATHSCQNIRKLTEEILTEIHELAANNGHILGSIEDILDDAIISNGPVASFDICILAGVERLEDPDIFSLLRFEFKKLILICDATNLEQDKDKNVAFRMVDQYSQRAKSFNHETESTVFSYNFSPAHQSKSSTTPSTSAASESFSSYGNTRSIHGGRHSIGRRGHPSRPPWSRGINQRNSEGSYYSPARANDFRIPKKGK